MPIFEPGMVSMLLARNPISFEHIYVWCPTINPYLSTYHSNLDAHVIVVLELGKSTLRGPLAHSF